MALSHSAFVPKLPCGTEPHGTAHIRSSFGHLTLQEQSAEAVEAEASREHATSRSADRIVTYPPRGFTSSSAPARGGRSRSWSSLGTPVAETSRSLSQPGARDLRWSHRVLPPTAISAPR